MKEASTGGWHPRKNTYPPSRPECHQAAQQVHPLGRQEETEDIGCEDLKGKTLTGANDVKRIVLTEALVLEEKYAACVIQKLLRNLTSNGFPA